mmetsp:Transcript_40888/g.74736  ORF Transcript_40888/g.74736 Transcript_40888/m.74736 type:complete len:298 (+) Transcript_40888:76-969(+)
MQTSVAMWTLALAVAHLICASHGRRAQMTRATPVEKSLAELQDPDVAKALATLLLASNPDAAFNVNMAAANTGRSQALATRRYYSALAREVSRPLVVVTMADEEPPKKKKVKSKAPKQKVKQPTQAVKGIMPPQEQTFFEGPPSVSETFIPGLSILTVFGIIPFAAAVSRQIWTRYKFTTRRMQIRSGYQGTDVVQVIWREVVDVKWLRRYFGTAGDLVFTLLDGSKIEVRSVPDFERNLAFVMKMCGEEVQKESDYPDGTSQKYLDEVVAGKQPGYTIEEAPAASAEKEAEPATTA